MIDNEAHHSSSYVPRSHARVRLDRFDSANEMCVYCSCGRIVALDRSEMMLKLSLKKELECTTCRNRRISNEIDYLNDLYDGLIDDECY